jgi:hypothetical protein
MIVCKCTGGQNVNYGRTNLYGYRIVPVLQQKNLEAKTRAAENDF